MSTVEVLDYDQVLTDLQTLIQANVTTFGKVSIEELDLNGPLTLHHRRQLDIQLIEAEDRVAAGNVYTTNVTIHLILACSDLSSYREAATLRNDLVKEVKELIRQNQRFNADILSTITRRTGFAEDQTERGFIAVAVIEIIVEAYEGEC